ncbi:DUF262 domain-containing protein [Peredibacter starrii]|uniref:DUF262 domain-containing protein n=1 Tax=Peredibacter starrii TaxID=28202 RepID=A0AAX4HT91_9BACT|nr:DUF262 domain-containing protein [Peredibacter starrii]WPU66524.1 DUF262 domain-containing protein [Peredibacter starrii]
MKQWEISKTVYTVGDFVGWQQSETLNLRPDFQRKSVWKKGAKSFLLDTISRGLPIPIILIRERRVSGKFEPIRDVVDGQQRLITIISFIAPHLIPNEIDSSSSVTISKNHNKELANKAFNELPEDMRNFILNYKFSVHILPSDMGDREILEIFSRMNSTGTKLNFQELRNAEWFGELKSSIYEMSYTHYENWVHWRTFKTPQLSRMADIEFTSELYHFIINGIESKDQNKLDLFYQEYDETFTFRKEVEKRFAHIMDFLDKELFPKYQGVFFSSSSHFYALFTWIYDLTYGISSSLTPEKPRKFSIKDISSIVLSLQKFETAKLPKKLEESLLKRRLKTIEFRQEAVNHLNSLKK